MLQGYLECGASRVVRVHNADGDWGVVALSKLAKGTTVHNRVFEAVLDSFHNDVSIVTITILFSTKLFRLVPSPSALLVSATLFSSKVF
jgi:hypothetical protein